MEWAENLPSSAAVLKMVKLSVNSCWVLIGISTLRSVRCFITYLCFFLHIFWYHESLVAANSWSSPTYILEFLESSPSIVFWSYGRKKIPRTKWLKQQKFISYSPGGWKDQDQGPAEFGFWWGLTSWFIDGGFSLGLSSVCNCRDGKKKRSLFLFFLFLLPIIRDPPAWLHLTLITS